MTYGAQSGAVARVVGRVVVVAVVGGVEGLSGLSLLDGLDGRPLVPSRGQRLAADGVEVPFLHELFRGDGDEALGHPQVRLRVVRSQLRQGSPGFGFLKEQAYVGRLGGRARVIKRV